MKKLIMSLIAMLSFLTGCAREKAASVGIIGGADGPTVVFVAGKINWFTIVGAILAIILMVVAIIYFIKKNKDRTGN